MLRSSKIACYHATTRSGRPRILYMIMTSVFIVSVTSWDKEKARTERNKVLRAQLDRIRDWTDAQPDSKSWFSWIRIGVAIIVTALTLTVMVSGLLEHGFLSQKAFIPMLACAFILSIVVSGYAALRKGSAGNAHTKDYLSDPDKSHKFATHNLCSAGLADFFWNLVPLIFLIAAASLSNANLPDTWNHFFASVGILCAILKVSFPVWQIFGPQSHTHTFHLTLPLAHQITSNEKVQSNGKIDKAITQDRAVAKLRLKINPASKKEDERWNLERDPSKLWFINWSRPENDDKKIIRDWMSKWSARDDEVMQQDGNGNRI